MSKTKKRSTLKAWLCQRTRRCWIVSASVLLALALLITALGVALNTAAAVYRAHGVTLREDAYRYWFASYKSVYLTENKELGVTDSADGWAKTSEEGVSYGALFDGMIDEEIRLRFLAAALFDGAGYRLSDGDYEELNTLIDELGEERFDERGFSVLREQYDVGKNAVKQVALFEQKYRALYERMFSDGAVVYSDAYRNSLREFYEKYYLRYNMIYVKAQSAAALESALADGVTEEEFTALEAAYNDTEHKITSGNYPNGIYLYAGGSYSRIFTAELISAFAEANEVGKWVKKADASGEGYYFVMRYALDEEPYFSEDEKVKNCFADLPSFAASYLYRAYLKEQLVGVSAFGVAERYSVTNVKTCADYNVVHLLGHG